MKHFIDKWEDLPIEIRNEIVRQADYLFISPMFVPQLYESGQFGFYETEK